KGSNGRDGLASCMATTRRKRKPHGQRRVAQCERFNCSCAKQSRSDVIPLLSFHMQTNGGCADVRGRMAAASAALRACLEAEMRGPSMSARVSDAGHATGSNQDQARRQACALLGV